MRLCPLLLIIIFIIVNSYSSEIYGIQEQHDVKNGINQKESFLSKFSTNDINIENDLVNESEQNSSKDSSKKVLELLKKNKSDTISPNELPQLNLKSKSSSESIQTNFNSELDNVHPNQKILLNQNSNVNLKKENFFHFNPFNENNDYQHINPLNLVDKKSSKVNQLLKKLNEYSNLLNDYDDTYIARYLFETLNSTNCTCPSVEELCADPPVDWTNWQIYLKLVGTVVLVAMSGFCAGMTTGFFSLDMNSLSIIAKSDPVKRNRKYAKNIIPVRRNGNLLLVTLILTNVFVNSAISILSADLTSGLLGFFLSSALIVIFGEIFPQALCVKYTLFIGSATVYFVYTFMFFLFPLAYPFSVILDFFLGKDLGQFYDIAGLKELIEIHAQSRDKTGLEYDSANILQGALDFANKKVRDVMTTQDNIFCVDVSAKLDAELLNSIWQTGHSRIPVYKGTKDNIVGILFVKDLIVLNPNDDLNLSTALLFFGKEPLRVDPELSLSEMLQRFKTSRSHLAIVQEAKENENGLDSSYSVVGLITLEDVIEEIIRDEIIDESDVYVSNLHNEKVTKRTDPTYSFRRGLTSRLTPIQIQTTAQFLERTSRFFQLLPPDYMKQLLGRSRIETIKVNDNSDTYIYKKGEQSEFFCLILSGKIEIISSEEGFVTYLGSWSQISIKSLIQKTYITDFDAKVVENSSILKIYKKDYIQEVRELFEEDENFYLPPELGWIDEKIVSVNDVQITVTDSGFEKQTSTSNSLNTTNLIPRSPSSNLTPKSPNSSTINQKGLSQIKSKSHTSLLDLNVSNDNLTNQDEISEASNAIEDIMQNIPTVTITVEDEIVNSDHEL